jgi:hypothetical protein
LVEVTQVSTKGSINKQNTVLHVYTFFLQYWYLSSGPCACYLSALPLEPHPRSSPFCFSYISDRISQFYPGPVSHCDSPTTASHVTGIKNVIHHVQLVCWDGFSLTFCPGWSQAAILPLSTSRVTGITDMYHHARSCICVLCIYHELLFNLKKEDLDTCYSIGEPWEHYAKWKKSNHKKTYCISHAHKVHGVVSS